jgi:thiamine biosynthesis lipoprotein
MEEKTVYKHFRRSNLSAGAGVIVAWLWGVLVAAAPPPPSARYQFSGTEMAVPIELVLYADSPDTATRGAQAAMTRLRQLNAVFSDYIEESELSRLSADSGGGKATPVSEDLWAVLARAQEISEKSEGAFDVTVGPVVRLWRWARRHHELPSRKRIDAARQLVDYRLIRLVPETHAVELLKPGMRLDLGGIAKGYAVAAALAVLRDHGIRSAMVHAGGDIVLGDPPPGEPGWRIGIAPLDRGGPPSQYLCLSRCAVAASGDTWQYVTIEGRRYSHVVDPRTGIGLTDHGTVTIVGPDSTTADALGKAVGVLGPEKGLQLVESMPGMAAHIVRSPNGKVETCWSSRWKDLPVAAKEPKSK